jgi:hypothetical protein
VCCAKFAACGFAPIFATCCELVGWFNALHESGIVLRANTLRRSPLVAAEIPWFLVQNVPARIKQLPAAVSRKVLREFSLFDSWYTAAFAGKDALFIQTYPALMISKKKKISLPVCIRSCAIELSAIMPSFCADVRWRAFILIALSSSTWAGECLNYTLPDIRPFTSSVYWSQSTFSFILLFSVYAPELYDLTGQPDFRDVTLQWRSNDPNARGFRIDYCEMQPWGRKMCRRKVMVSDRTIYKAYVDIVLCLNCVNKSSSSQYGQEESATSWATSIQLKRQVNELTMRERNFGDMVIK